MPQKVNLSPFLCPSPTLLLADATDHAAAGISTLGAKHPPLSSFHLKEPIAAAAHLSSLLLTAPFL
jgi:hypothetical protein